MRCRSLWVIVVLTLVLGTWGSLVAENWPQWRGPKGNGHSSESDIPVKWDQESIRWQTDLKGRGQSSPIIWGDRIFLTTALENGKQRMVFCVDRTNGKILWEEVAWKGESEKTHRMNGWASSSCATDGEHVYAFFGKGGLHCYTVEGKHVWSRDLGAFPGSWGTAASPILVGDLLVQNCDAVGESSLLAVDKKTGKTVWNTPRDAKPRGGWSTPILFDAGDRQVLVLNGEKGVTSYDPKTGKPIWFCKNFRGRGEPTITPGNGLLFSVCGQPGDMCAIRPGGTGDVTKTHMVWHAPRKTGRDQPSPILVGDYLIVVSMSGFATCYQSQTGKELWKERLGGNFVGSPIAVGKLVYCLNDSGETVVLEPGPEPNIVMKNKLNASKDEIFRASPTPCQGQMFLRSDRRLYCVGSGTTSGEK